MGIDYKELFDDNDLDLQNFLKSKNIQNRSRFYHFTFTLFDICKTSTLYIFNTVSVYPYKIYNSFSSFFF